MSVPLFYWHTGTHWRHRATSFQLRRSNSRAVPRKVFHAHDCRSPHLKHRIPKRQRSHNPLSFTEEAIAHAKPFWRTIAVLKMLYSHWYIVSVSEGPRSLSLSLSLSFVESLDCPLEIWCALILIKKMLESAEFFWESDLRINVPKPLSNRNWKLKLKNILGDEMVCHQDI